MVNLWVAWVQCVDMWCKVGSHGLHCRKACRERAGGGVAGYTLGVQLHRLTSAVFVSVAALSGITGCLRLSTYSNADTGHSYVAVFPENIAADGNHGAAVQVVARQADNRPLTGQHVQVVVETGVLQVQQPTAPTDSAGRTAGQLASSATGEHPVSAALQLSGTALPLGGASSLVNVYASPVPGSDAVGGDTPLNLTVIKPDGAGLADASFTGSVQLSSTDGAAVLPAPYTYSAADGGLHIFRGFKLRTPGSQTVSAQTADGNVLRSVTFTVVAASAAPPTQLALSTSASVIAGGVNSLLVYARDASGAATAALAGTVHFSSSDANAVLPADYLFTSSDRGQHSFSLQLLSAGTQQVSVSLTGLAGASQSVIVGPGLPRYLRFATQPTNASACQPLNPAVQVQEYDAYGNPAVTFGDTVQLTLNGNTPGAVLQGNVQTRTVQGVASFHNIAVNLRGTFTLGADIGYEPQLSLPFSVGAETPVVSSLGPVAGSSGNIGIPYVLRDACGTPVQLSVAFDPNNSGVYRPATLAPSDASYQGTANVTASAAGTAGAYLWNSAHDLGNTTWPAMRVRLVATVHGVDSAPALSAPFLLDNGPSLGTNQELNRGTAEGCVAMVDVNHDARIDLLTCDGAAHTVSVLLGDGNSTATPAPSLALPAAPQSLDVGAMDSNAGIDLVVAAGKTLWRPAALPRRWPSQISITTASWTLWWPWAAATK